MNALRNALIDAIGEGSKTTEQLCEDTGYERRPVLAELQAMRSAEIVRPGPGGWRAIDGTAPPPVTDMPTTRTHYLEPPEPASAPPKRQRRGRRPKAATVAEITTGRVKPRTIGTSDKVAVAFPLTREARYIFGLTERGELAITDIKDYSKTAHFSAHDTARLLDVLDRWRPMLQPLPEVA